MKGSPGAAVKRLGVVGLGHMGHAFAANLIQDGYEVTVYDRDRQRAMALRGAVDSAQLADLAKCDVVVTSLPDDDALAAMALEPQGLAGILAPDTVHASLGRARRRQGA
jgi:3-hydroxyisobutyrate dehydrogenase-like beta-hydroxyacid dehydrogenase